MPAGSLRAFLALVAAGYRRFSTYRQAMFAGAFTNCVFGFLKCYVILAVASSAGSLAGYDLRQLATYVWVNQGVIAVINVWGEPDLVARIRTGDVVSDLLRPLDLMWAALATEVGRAGFALLIRFTAPIAVGAVFFDLYIPGNPADFVRFACALALAVVLSFCCRHLLALSMFWYLDVRGPFTAWVLCSGLFGGLMFPLQLWPHAMGLILTWATPFPLLFQGPVDVLLGRGPWLVLGRQVLWVAVLVGACRLVQHRAMRKLVVQGG